MKTSQLSFELPEGLIAQIPSPNREDARLLVLDRMSGRTEDCAVHDLPNFIAPGTIIVFNDSRVRKARLFLRSPDCARVEMLLLSRKGPGLWECMVGRARSARLGRRLLAPGGVSAEVIGGKGESRLVRFSMDIDDAYLERYGHVPLPPYIKREDTPEDEERYQTVFARETGSAAAPTAGLHFTPELFSALRSAGAEIAYATLHVGLGTFLPIRSEAVEDHAMHEEFYNVPRITAELVENARSQGRPVLAVGTSVVRTLESAWHDGQLREGDGRTQIFIYPGYSFKAVNMLFTNFHTPGSSLLAMVCAFAGRELILDTYRRAVEKRYRFFSYGDAMLIQ